MENAWAELRTTAAPGATPPKARGGHTAVLVEKNLLIQGGQQHKNAGVFEYFSLNPTVLDTETHTWFQPRVALGKGPVERAYHTTTRVGSSLFIFGGSTAKKAGESGILGDMPIFDLPNTDRPEPTRTNSRTAGGSHVFKNAHGVKRARGNSTAPDSAHVLGRRC